ncbi:MAG: hypothetical protein ABIH38_02220 [Patescibacteria group bacterium]
MKKKYLNRIILGFIAPILVVFSFFYLEKSGIFGPEKRVAVGEEINSEAPFPSAKSYGYYLMPYTRFGEYGSGAYPDYSAEDVFNFWLDKHDLIINSYLTGDYKAAAPEKTIIGGTSATEACCYDYAANEYFWDDQLTILHDWITENWQTYPWSSQFSSADVAFEDCFLHLSSDVESMTFSFTTTEDLTITGYNPVDPTRSRIPGDWSNDLFLANVKSPVYISFWQDYYAVYMIERWGSPTIDGYFLDVHEWTLPQYFSTEEDFEKIIEFTSREEYLQKLSELTIIIRDTLHQNYPGSILAVNTYNTIIPGDPPKYAFEDEVDFCVREGSIIYNLALEKVEQEISIAYRLGNAGKLVAMQHDTRDFYDLNRGKIAGLAVYYMAMTDNVYFYTYVPPGPAYDPYSSWFEAIAYDIGEPAGEYYVFAQGLDPSNLTGTYKVLARNFTKGLVLVKPRPNWSVTNYLSQSQTTHNLGGTYRSLNVDGTLGDPITSITLRNWEGAILLENDTAAPESIDDLTAS